MDQLLWLTQLERTLDNLRYQPEEIDTTLWGEMESESEEVRNSQQFTGRSVNFGRIFM